MQDLTLTVEKGEFVFLTGPSGAGKSTVTAILLRFYNPDAGRLLIDGRDARDYPLHWLRGQMAIVPQDVLLFGGSIAENIVYGRPGADDAAIREAARLANAHDFIMQTEHGYQTVIGERGSKLSGGQRQRLSIARAVLKNPPILILDEATSALDEKTEEEFLSALRSLHGQKTIIVISHRPASIEWCNRVIVLEDGRIVADQHAIPVASRRSSEQL